MEKGRIASALLVPICKSPWFDGWLESAPPAAAKCKGRKLTAAAAAARTLRRVGNDEFVDTARLLG
jgi:hypothetical protein